MTDTSKTAKIIRWYHSPVAYLGVGPRCDPPFGRTMKIFYRRLYMKRCVFCHFPARIAKFNNVWWSYAFPNFRKMGEFVVSIEHSEAKSVSASVGLRPPDPPTRYLSIRVFTRSSKRPANVMLDVCWSLLDRANTLYLRLRARLQAVAVGHAATELLIYYESRSVQSLVMVCLHLLLWWGREVSCFCVMCNSLRKCCYWKIT